MSSVIRLPNGKIYVFLKGASEFVVEICDNLISFETNQKVPLDAIYKKWIENNIQHMAMQSLRTIGVCYKEVKIEDLDFNNKDERGVYHFEKSDFTLLCLFGIWDTIWEEVPLCIQKCHYAGI